MKKVFTCVGVIVVMLCAVAGVVAAVHCFMKKKNCECVFESCEPDEEQVL